MKRSKALQIYMKPGIREDDLLLEVWEACRKHARTQDVFRAILRAGLRTLVEEGAIPNAVVEACNLENRGELRRKRRGSHEAQAPAQAFYTAVPYPPGLLPQAAIPVVPAAPAAAMAQADPQPAVAREQEPRHEPARETVSPERAPDRGGHAQERPPTGGAAPSMSSTAPGAGRRIGNLM
jgi:hypothetical protein